MIAHARELAPHECCGMLAGKDGRVTHHYKIANIVATEGAHLANFAASKLARWAHLQTLSPEERADIAFVMDARDMSLASMTKAMSARSSGERVCKWAHLANFDAAKLARWAPSVATMLAIL